MALHIHHGAQLTGLCHALATLLETPLSDPFATEVVAVPTAGIRDWLQQQLALRLGASGLGNGISANIDMPFPGGFIGRALGQAPTSTNPWDIDHLTWSVLQVLQSPSSHVPDFLAQNPHDAAGTRGRYSTARRIADLFDGYENNRPEMLQQWAIGRDGDGTFDENTAVVPLAADQLWQPALWREVQSLIVQPSRAEQLPQLLADLSRGEIEPLLPQRVSVFGISAVSPGQLSVINALAAVREVHLFLLHPSVVAWQQCRQQLAGRLTLRSACDATANVSHRLTRSWARPSMEAAALLRGLSAQQFEYPHPLLRALDAAPPAPRSLLHQLQADIAADHDPSGTHPFTDDNSVQVHACHGATRQLEVLRDALGHLFAADPTLTPHDVIVVCPDLPRFAPLAASVFARGSLPVPVYVSDLSLGATNPVAVALTTVIHLVAGRCTAAELLGLCALAPIQQCLGLSEDDISTIDRWISDLNTTWGLDTEHRRVWLSDDFAEGTWAASIDRLLMGAAMATPSPRVGPDGIVPFDDVPTGGLRTAGLLAELVARLRVARTTTLGDHPIDYWVDALTNIARSLFATAPNDAWQLAQVISSIEDLRTNSKLAGAANEVPLALNDIRALLTDINSAPRGRLTLRSGAVTITGMVPVRNLAARVICILGLDESSLRSSGSDGDDLLGARPCVGERDPRVEGRHLLLDALMAAGEQFIITCDGSDITTNRKLPLPVQLIEFKDTVAATLNPHELGGFSIDTAVEQMILTRHPRQAYDESNFTVGKLPAAAQPGQPFSFDNGMLDAAIVRREPATTLTSGTATPLPPIVPDTVRLADLAQSCTRPSRTYLIDRLDVRMPGQPDEIATEIPLDISPLDSSQIGTDLLAQYRRASSPEQREQWRIAQQLSGALPPRELSQSALNAVESEVTKLIQSHAELAELITHSESALIDLRLTSTGAEPVSAQLVDTLTGLAGHTLVRVHYNRPNPRYQLTAALHLAAAVVAYPDHPWKAVVATRGDSSTKPKPEWLTPPAGPLRVAAAQHLLDVALTLRLQALCEPLPLFEHTSADLYATGCIDETKLDKDFRDTYAKFLWEDADPDQLLPAAAPLARVLWDAYHSFLTEPAS